MDANPDNQLPSKLCPKCSNHIPIEKGFVPWCDKCDWNVVVEEKSCSPFLKEKIYDALGKRLSRKLFERVSNSPNARLHSALYRILALIMACFVTAINLSILLGGIYLFIKNWPKPVMTSLGLLFVGIGIVLFPSMGKWPKKDVLKKSDYPLLYGLLDRLADCLKTKRIDGIILDENFNASVTQLGFRRRRLLTLGIPLLWALQPQEIVALLGHEMAHMVNGDPLRGFFFFVVFRALNRWYYFLRPNSLWDRNLGIYNLTLVPFKLILWGLSKAVEMMYSFISHLLWQDCQLAEYKADYMAAQVASTQAATDGLEKLFHGDSLHLCTQKMALGKISGDLLDNFKAQVGTVSPREKERCRRACVLLETKLDATHPPTSFRVDVLKKYPVEVPKFIFRENEMDALKVELKSEKERAQKLLVDSYNDSLYRRAR